MLGSGRPINRAMTGLIKLAMGFPRRSRTGRRRPGKCIKSAKPYLLAMRHTFGRPSSCLSAEPNPLHPGRIGRLQSGVHHILRHGRQSNILGPIVRRVSVSVIDVKTRPLAVDHRPSNNMCSDQDIVDADEHISEFGFVSCDPALLFYKMFAVLHDAISPSEGAGGGIVGKQLVQSGNGRLLFHATQYRQSVVSFPHQSQTVEGSPTMRNGTRGRAAGCWQ